jgi:hypothetical protein
MNNYFNSIETIEGANYSFTVKLFNNSVDIMISHIRSDTNYHTCLYSCPSIDKDPNRHITIFNRLRSGLQGQGNVSFNIIGGQMVITFTLKGDLSPIVIPLSQGHDDPIEAPISTMETMKQITASADEISKLIESITETKDIELLLTVLENIHKDYDDAIGGY